MRAESDLPALEMGRVGSGLCWAGSQSRTLEKRGSVSDMLAQQGKTSIPGGDQEAGAQSSGTPSQRWGRGSTHAARLHPVSAS